MRLSRSLLLQLAVAASIAGSAFAQNDDCAGAVFVTNGANGPFTNVGSTTSAPAWPCAAGGNDVWYQYVSGGVGTLTVDTCGSGFDTALEIFDGSAGCGALVSLGCNDDSCGLQSSLTVGVNVGLYYIRVGGFAGSTGSFTLNVNGPATSGTIATNTAVGLGCGSSLLGDGSAYELFDGTGSNFDLSNTSHSYVWLGDGYILLPTAASSFVTPAGTGLLALADDSVLDVSLPFTFPSPQGFRDTIYVCSNGYLWFRLNQTADFTESVTEFLTQDSRLCFLWDDLNPSAGGTVTGEIDPSNPNAFHITFTDVPQFASTDQNTVQVTLFATGDIDVKYGNVNLVDAIVGVTSGNGATDPGSSDFSTLPIGPIVTGQQFAGLGLNGVTRPVTGTNWNLAATNILPGAVFGIGVFGLVDPNIPDLGFLGMPGCQLRTSLDLLSAPVVLAPGATSMPYGLPIPQTQSLVGLEIFTQGVVFGNGVNSFDALTSQGIKGTVGDI